MVDFINSNTFRDIAHFVVYPPDGKFWTDDILKQNAVIYTQVGPNLDTVLNNLRFSNRKYILITHTADWFVNKHMFETRPKCIVKWFAECTDYEHPDLIPIPIGLSPHKDSDKGSWDVEWFMQEKNLERLRVKPKNDNVLYCTWNYINNIRARTGVLKTLRNNGIECLWDRLGQEEGPGEYKSWYEYLENASQYRFHVSPAGAGFDSHRTWDALYMGCFPIVIKHPTFKFTLPIIQVNNWGEVTLDLLHSYLNKEHNMEQLYMSYWTNRIFNEFNKLL